MMYFIRYLSFLCFVAALVSFFNQSSGFAQDTPEFSLDLSLDHVDITTSFNGSQIILYGSKPNNSDVAITLVGPSRAMVVRKKDQVGPFWINVDSLHFYNVPTYYDFATSIPESVISSSETLASLKVGLNSLDFSPSYTPGEEQNVSYFEEALVRNKQVEQLFPLQAETIEYINDNFFKVVFFIPPQLPTGPYLIEGFLFRDGELISRKSQKLIVAQTGLNARLSDFANNYGFLYGIFSIFVALISGWAAYQAGMRK